MKRLFLYKVIVLGLISVTSLSHSFSQRLDPIKTLEEVRNFFLTEESYFIQIEHYWYNSFSAEEQVDYLKAEFLKASQRMYADFDGRLSLVQKDMLLMVFKESEVMMLQPYQEGGTAATLQLPIDSIMKKYTSFDLVKVSENACRIECQMDDPMYERIVINVSLSPSRLQSMTLFLKNWEGHPARLELYVHYLPFPSRGELRRKYSLEHFISRPGSAATPTAPYQSYQFHNQLSQP